MLLRATAACSLIALLCAPAYAGSGPGVAVYYIPESDLESGGDDEGDGFGARADTPLGDRFRVHAEYQVTDYDVLSDFEITQLRAGGSMAFRGQGYNFGPVVEFIRAELDSDTGSDELDGYGVHLRGEAEFQAPEMNYWAQVGFVRLDDQRKLDGMEWLAGASVAASPNVAFYIDVRHANLSDEAGGGLELTDFRAGVRFSLN